MTNWIIASKLKAPLRHAREVPREALLCCLDDVLNAKVTLIHAPAGYGKTTCLGMFQKRMYDQGTVTAWLTLDTYDSGLFQFLHYLMESFRAAGFLSSYDIPDLSRESSIASESEIGGAVVTALGKCQGPHVIILDDFHRAQSEEGSHFLNYLIQSVPDNIHLVISTREMPSDIPLADLRLHDDLLVVDHKQLRFSESEIHDYLDYFVSTEQDLNWALELLKRTEGWPVALQVVRRWLKEGTSISETVKQLSGRTIDLSDYFIEQVFNTLSDDSRNFLLLTSILERVNGDIGNQLYESDGGWELLRELESREMFVQPVNQDRSWYRYHRLFSEFLQERLRRTPGVDLSILHERAARWFADNGEMLLAIQHALTADDAGLCAEILEALGGWRFVLQGHVELVQKVLDKVDRTLLADYPRLWLADFFLRARVGDVSAMEYEIAAFDARWLADSADESIRADSVIVKTLVRRYTDQEVTTGEILELENLEWALDQSAISIDATRCNLLCYLYRETGRLEESLQAGDRAITCLRSMGSIWGEAFIYFHEGQTCYFQGRMRDAESLYLQGYEIAVGTFGETSDLAAIASAFLAQLSYEKNRLKDAEKYLERALPHIERADAWIDVYLAAYLTRLKLDYAALDPAAITKTASRARSTAINRGLGRLESLIGSQLEKLRLQEGQTGGGIAQVAESTGTYGPYQFVAAEVRVRRLLAAGELEAAEKLAVEQSNRAKEMGYTLIQISLLALLAKTQFQRGDLFSARSSFELALSASISEGIKRVFIDEGTIIRDLVRELSGSAEFWRGNRLRDAFLSELMAQIDEDSSSGMQEPQLLSPRERQVMRHIMQGESNRETAEALELSVNTVKFHLKNVFEKLGVSSRKEAVTAATRRNLI